MQDSLLLDAIEKNEELKIFFMKFSKYFDVVESKVKEQIKQETELARPSIQGVIDAINLLQTLGIDLKNTEEWLYTEMYEKGNNKAIDIFTKVTFNGVTIDAEDIDDLIKKYSSNTVNLAYEYLSEKKYKEWLNENKKIEKKYKKLKLQYESSSVLLNSIDSPAEAGVFMDFVNCKREIERGKELKQKADFFHKLGQDTRLILEAFDQINLLHENYSLFNVTKNEIKNKYYLKFDLEAEKSFNKMISDSLVEIDIERIVRLLFKEIVLCRAKEITTNTSLEEESENFNFNVEAVYWFYDFKFEEIFSLMNLMFDNYETLMDDFNIKIKQKKL